MQGRLWPQRLGRSERDHDLAINIFKGGDVRQRHTLVELVNGRIGWTQLDNLGANLSDESPIAGATRG